MRYHHFDKHFHLSFTQLVKGWAVVAFIFLALGYAWGWGAMRGVTEMAEESRDQAELKSAVLVEKVADLEAQVGIYQGKNKRMARR